MVTSASVFFTPKFITFETVPLCNYSLASKRLAKSLSDRICASFQKSQVVSSFIKNNYITIVDGIHFEFAGPNLTSSDNRNVETGSYRAA